MLLYYSLAIIYDCADVFIYALVILLFHKRLLKLRKFSKYKPF